MNNVIQFPTKHQSEAPREVTDAERRVAATIGLAKEAWFVIFLPFGLFGLFAHGWVGFLAGSMIGSVVYGFMLLTMRYGSEP